MLNIAITGAFGRMGQAIANAVITQSNVQLTVGLEHENSNMLGQDIGIRFGHTFNTVATTALTSGSADVLIDFSRPSVTLAYAKQCAELGVAMVVGTTGFTQQELNTLKDYSKQIPIVYSQNMSPAVNVLFALTHQASKLLKGFDTEVIEWHHKHKVDAPSGTALKLGHMIANAKGLDFNTHAVLSREGITGERKPDEIGFATVRAGDIVGDHVVMFAGEGETIELKHSSKSRNHYANGAIKAAQFLQDKQHGFFSMFDVLGIAL